MAPRDLGEGEGSAPTNGKSTKQLVTQRFTLCDGRETAVLDLFGVELERAIGELEPLLNERRELTNTPSLLSQHFLCVRRADNNLFLSNGVSGSIQGRTCRCGVMTTHLGTSVCHADFTT
jgi:hypothetical protein